jgi:hypothetical protein
VERTVDLARVNDRIFVNNASLGLYAHVVQSDAYRDSKFGTWRRALPRMLGPDKAESIDLQFHGPDGSDWTDAALVVVSNNPYQLKRLGGAGSRLRLDGGHLGIAATRIRRATDLAKLVTLEGYGHGVNLLAPQRCVEDSPARQCLLPGSRAPAPLGAATFRLSQVLTTLLFKYTLYDNLLLLYAV